MRWAPSPSLPCLLCRHAEQRDRAVAVPQRAGLPRRTAGGTQGAAVAGVHRLGDTRGGALYQQLHARLPLLAHAIGIGMRSLYYTGTSQACNGAPAAQELCSWRLQRAVEGGSGGCCSAAAAGMSRRRCWAACRAKPVPSHGMQRVSTTHLSCQPQLRTWFDSDT